MNENVNENVKMPETISMNKKKLSLLIQFSVNGHFVVGIYQGTLSEFDIIVKYKQLINNEWTRPRTPKHVHWAVDILIKQNTAPEDTEKFINLLLKYWDNIKPFKNKKDRDDFLNAEKLKNEINNEAVNFQQLEKKGEYSVKFLLLLAKLLMHQEKTNNKNAYMFKNLLEKLKNKPDIFSIISLASFR